MFAALFLLIGLAGLKLAATNDPGVGTAQARLLLVSSLFALISAYGVFRMKGWAVPAYTVFVFAALARLSLQEGVSSVIETAGAIVLVGAVWTAVGLYLRSAIARHGPGAAGAGPSPGARAENGA